MSEVERYWIAPSRLVQEGWHQDDTCVVKDWAYDRVVAERDALQQRLTAADERADVLEGLLHLARGAIGENQWTLLTKDIDAMLSQDAQLTNKSGNAHCPHDGICHTSEETCAEAQARIESLTATAGADQ
ncbi:hypothetical protein [Pseudomonas veronii]|uniref:hypothetical protein n=1 Tax=Pseudomonas veronii TaxID=76761 RepID=UPI000F8235BE|nr:hypothetical protein [Pseudomonas veronii]RTY75556.1 hypothetical protein EKA83_15825 [Pseudomonas veronii]